MPNMHKWYEYNEFDQAAQAAAEFIADVIVDSIEKRELCHVILPGGNTPKTCLGYLGKKSIPWDKVHWYPGDERCCPINHADRNDVMLQKYLWSLLPNAKKLMANIHCMPAELGPEKAAKIYEKVVSAVENFDIAFLGLGEDGHTASLFPGNSALEDQRRVVPVYNSPKPPAERVSLSINVFRKTRHRIILASTLSTEKAKIIQRIKTGENLPVNMLGDIDWYIDKA